MNKELKQKRKTIKKICLICDKEFNARVEKDNVGKYCNKDCSHKGLIKKIDVNCETCNKKFKKVKCHFKRTKRNFCSMECYKNSPHLKKKYKDKNGYVLIKKSEHPFANNRGYVREHRLVIEKKLGRYLDLKNETVHHRNGIKDDNRIENLELVLRTAHFGRVKCPSCQKIITIR